jgi:hypothetical protein
MVKIEVMYPQIYPNPRRRQFESDFAFELHSSFGAPPPWIATLTRRGRWFDPSRAHHLIHCKATALRDPCRNDPCLAVPEHAVNRAQKPREIGQGLGSRFSRRSCPTPRQEGGCLRACPRTEHDESPPQQPGRADADHEPAGMRHHPNSISTLAGHSSVCTTATSVEKNPRRLLRIQQHVRA